MSLSPEEITSRRFVVALRGYDKDEVDAFLKEVGTEVADLLEQAQHAELPERDRGDGLERFAEHLTSVLRSAVAAAEQITTEARREVAELRAAAAQEVAALRGAAAQEVTELRTAADRDIAELRAAAAHEITELRAAAAREVAELRAAADQDIQAQRHQASAAIAEHRTRWERKRSEAETADAEARKRAHQEIAEATAAASQALKAAQEKEARAAELNDAATRQLEESEAIDLDARQQASAILARANEEANRIRTETINRLKSSIEDLVSITPGGFSIEGDVAPSRVAPPDGVADDGE